MVLGKGSARGRHHVLHAALVKAYQVEITFYDDDRVFFGDGVLAVVQPEKDVTLMVKDSFRAVHVFCRTLAGKVAPSEGHHHAGNVLDGNHQAVPELVGNTAVLFFYGKARLDAFLGREAFLGGVAYETFAAVGSVADVELLAGWFGNMAAVQVLKSLWTAGQLFFEPLTGQFVQLADQFTLFGDFGPFGVAHAGQLKTAKIRHPFHGGVKVDFFVFLHELEHVSAGTAGKALVDAQGGVYIHGGGVVVVEGAHPNVASVARPFQGQKLLNDGRDVGFGFELLDDFVRVEGHGPNLAFYV